MAERRRLDRMESQMSVELDAVITSLEDPRIELVSVTVVPPCPLDPRIASIPPRHSFDVN